MALIVGGKLHDGIEFFFIMPTVTSGKPGGPVLDRYVAAAGLDLYYPALGASPDVAPLTMSISGSSLFPDLAYFDGEHIHIATQGVAPEDGFSGYPPTGAGVARWGDYTAATIDEDSNFWIDGEWIPNSCTLVEYTKDPLNSSARTTSTPPLACFRKIQAPHCSLRGPIAGEIGVHPRLRCWSPLRHSDDALFRHKFARLCDQF